MDSRAVAPPFRPAFLQTKGAVRLSPSWHQSSVSGRIQHLTTGHHVMTACRLWPFRGGIPVWHGYPPPGPKDIMGTRA
jgi:hypothetical protein